MDPSLQEFYSLSRSTSVQQRPLSQADLRPSSRASSRQQQRARPATYYRQPSQSSGTPSGSYAWSSSYHPLSVPSIAQIAIPQSYRDIYQDSILPGDNGGRAPSRRRHQTATDGYFGASTSLPIDGRRSHNQSQDADSDDDLILDDPLGSSPPSLSVNSSRYTYGQEEHLENLDDDYDGLGGGVHHIPGEEGQKPRYSTNHVDAQRRGSGDRGDDGVAAVGNQGGSFGEDIAENRIAEDGQDQEQDLKEDQIPADYSMEPTPLPKVPLFVLSVVIFSEPLTSTILFPFVYFMVRDFHITENEEEIGFFCGLIASSFFFAQFCTSIFWGYMSDRYGRRPILLLGLIGSTIACLFFGLSKSLVWAITSRSMCGLLNGNVGVAKSMLGEIADSTNQSQAFSIFGFAWGIGMIVGPVLGGYLANPAQNFPDTFGHWPFFIEYPYFLPCLIAAIGSVVGFIVGYFFLEETRGRKSLASTVEDNKIDATNGDHDYYPGSYQQQEEQQQQNELIERQNYVNAPMKTTNTDINSEIVDVDGLERQPLMLPPNAIQAQQVKFANRRSMGTASNQYGSMSTLSHEAGSVSPTESPYRLGLHRLQTASARSTLSRRPTPARPGLFRELTSASGTGSGMSIPVSSVFTTSYSERPLSSGVVGGPRQSLYAYSRPMSSGGLFSMADPSSLGLRGADGAGEIEIPADATLLTFGGYTNDPYLDSRGVVGGPDAFMESGRVSRMSYAPSQVFLLPPDPNNKDPNQPIQVLVVQQAPPVEGLSPMSITTIVAYAMLALHSIVFEEVYTLYAVTPMVSHGLGWNATQLATSLASMGLVQLILQFVVYPRLERRFSAVLLFRVSQLLYCCVYLAFPMIRQFAVDELDMEHGGQIARVRYMVLAGLVFKYVCSVFSYTSVMVMITNSAPAHLLGTVNGIGQTSASFMRAFGPALGGILWAWSLSNKLEFPFNYFFVFFLMGTIALLGFVHSFSIPKELARKRM